MRKRSVARLIPCLGLLASVLLGVQVPASADLWGQCYNTLYQCKPDSSIHTWCFGSTMDGNPNLQDAATYAMQNLEQQTVMTRQSNSPCSAVTDVNFQSRNLPPGVRGEHECLQLASSEVCDANAVRMDGEEIAAQGPPGEIPRNRDKTACHEVGHTVGMEHHDPPYVDCMISGPVSSGHVTYSDHHAHYHVNGYFA